MLESKGNSGLLTTLEANWQAEMEDRATYQSFAAKELNSRRRNVMRGLAATEEHHADLWAGRIRALGGPESIYSGKLTVEPSLSWAWKEGLILLCGARRSMKDTTS